MNKIEFIEALRRVLSGLPKNEIDERLDFYCEMIADRVEDGFSEEDAVNEIGSVEEIAEQIVADIPLSKLVKVKVKPKRKLRVWEIVLITVGSPIWLSLLISLVAVIFSLYVSWWSVIVSLWSVFVSAIGSSLGAIAVGIMNICMDNVLSGIAMIGAALVLAGISILLYYGCMAATKVTLTLTKKFVLGIKCCFIRKENA